MRPAVFTELEHVGKDFRDNNVIARMLEPVWSAWHVLILSPLKQKEERAPPQAFNLIEWHRSHLEKLSTASHFFDLFNQSGLLTRRGHFHILSKGKVKD